MIRTIRSLATLAGGVLAALLLLAAPAGAAGAVTLAHGGPIELDVHGDGGQGVTATVAYRNDHHPVSGEVVLSLTAVSAGGEKVVGPIPMVASSEGQSFYVSKRPLPVGDWTVTVTATKPSPATATISVRAVELPSTHHPDPAPAPSGNPTLVVVGGMVLIAAALTAVYRLRRRKHAARV